jgi:histone H3/H4
MGLVVASAAKDAIKKAEMNCGGDFVEALDKRIEHMISEAVARAKHNDRKTVRAGDL